MSRMEAVFATSAVKRRNMQIFFGDWNNVAFWTSNMVEKVGNGTG
jgi:hypothetical protein